MVSTYLIEERPKVLSTRLTAADRRIVEAAAAASGARSVSAYVADRITRLARRELSSGGQGNSED